MNRGEMAKAVARVLEAFSCPEIQEVCYLGEEFAGDGATVAVQSTDGARFFLEVQDV